METFRNFFDAAAVSPLLPERDRV